MKINSHTIIATGLVLCTTLLSACGGGGGSASGGGDSGTGGGSTGGGSTLLPSTFSMGACSASTGAKIGADASVTSGKVAGATVQACGGVLRDISWTQVSGPSVSLQANQSPTVAFDTDTVGTVRLRADVVLVGGATASQTVDITVAPASANNLITLRADHSVRPATDTSVRAWVSSGASVKSITWIQTGGPTVAMDTSDNKLLVFTSPNVSADTILTFRATLTTTDGRTDADDIAVAVEYEGKAVQSDSFFGHAERVHAYRSTSPYASVLAKCTYDISISNTLADTANTRCTAGVLPLLQADAGALATPSVAQVMNRVVVSHDFLGANFEQFLQTQDPNGDFRRLLGSVTAIVIGSHVRPSFYTEATGAIYLDADNFWLTPQQRDVVTEVADYREAYAKPFQYTHLNRMVLNGDYADKYIAPDVRQSRSVSDLVYQAGRLLYHELGHANDFFSPTNRALTSTQKVYDAVLPRLVGKTLPSDLLAAQYPLMSAEMKALASVLYSGATATNAQKAYTAAQVGAYFGADRATDDYAYVIYNSDSPREDLAMMFEEFMMYSRRGVRYDTVYTNLYTSGMTASQLNIAWGQRGRIGETAVRPRIKLVLANMFPTMLPADVDALPAPFTLTGTWASSLSQSSAPPPAGTVLLGGVMTSDALADTGRLRAELRNASGARPHR